MRFLNTITRALIHRFRQNKVTTIFFMVGMILSMLIVSISISFSYEIIYAEKNKRDNMPPNGRVYSIKCKEDVKCTGDDILHLFEGIQEETGIIINNLMVHPKSSKLNSYNLVSAEFFARDEGWHYPLVSGRYYTAEEIKNGEKVVLIGERIKDYTREADGKQYIDIYDTEYEVLGVVGLEGQLSLWDNRIFMPCTALPTEVMEPLLTGEDRGSLIIYNASGDMKKDIDVINANGKSIIKGFKLKNEGPIEVENVVKQLLQSQNPIFILAILGYCVTLIYAINIVIFWLEKRRYEIGVRKAFGYTDKDIAKMIFGEMAGLALLSGIMAFAVQMILSAVIGRISDYILKLYVPNIIVGMGVVVLTAVLTSIWPVINALKIPSAEVVKEGEKV